MRFCLACNSVPENWHICVNEDFTYLNTTAATATTKERRIFCSCREILGHAVGASGHVTLGVCL